jgi:hypothetical protein
MRTTDATQPERIWKTGERCAIRINGPNGYVTAPGRIVMANYNGKALIVEHDLTSVGGEKGEQSYLWFAGAFQCLCCGAAIKLFPLEEEGQCQTTQTLN